MWTLDDIMRNDNFEQLSKSDILEIVLILRNDLKYHLYRKDRSQDNLTSELSSLRSQLDLSKAENDRLKKVNNNVMFKFTKPLSIIERIKGRIDLSK